MKTKILPLCLLLLIFGCGRQKHEEQLSTIDIIDIVEGIEGDERVMFDEIVEDFAFIPLETTDGSFISKGVRFYLSDKYILASNRNQLLLFDITGKFIRKISDRGQGPGEYLTPVFPVMVKDELFVWDYSRSTVLCYSLPSGAYKRGKRLDFHANSTVNSMDCFNDSILVFYTNQVYEETRPDVFPHLHTLSLDFSTISELWSEKFTNINDLDEESFLSAEVSTYVKDGNLYIWDNTSIDNTVFYLNDSMQRVPAYKFFLGEYDSKGREPSAGEKKFKICDIKETDRFLFIGGTFAGGYQHILYDKITKKSANVALRTKALPIHFNDDEDGGRPFWPNGYVSRNILHCFFSPPDWEGNFSTGKMPQNIKR